MYEGSVMEDSPPTYIKGDIVWVKLSGYWWPGEVKNEEDLPSDMISDFKKRPLVIVKFFEEDSYEYIKHWSNIHPYNCEKKINFIKKGMAGFRAKLPHLATFPRDIGTAEEKTNGNPNILSQPEYLPNKKINYEEIFGDGKSSSAVRKSVSNTNDSLITHRRFLGNDDYKAYIMIQPDSDNDEPEEVLVCHSCPFTTSRSRVLLWHSRIHIEGLYITKRKSKKVKHIELSDSDSETVGAVAQQPKPKQRKKKVAADTSKSSDVFTNLLEEWDDTEEETEDMETPEKSKKPKSKNLKSKVGDNDKHSNKVTPNGTSDTSKVLDSSSDIEVKNTQEDIKNCFDFDEEEDEEDFLFPASTGRKIPRVIPEKPRASISELMEQSQKEDEASKGEPEAAEKADSVDDNQLQDKSPTDDTSLENTFKELMSETEVPVLENLAQSLKPEQNFHDARTIKFPDKGGTALKGTSPKSGTSKKRFITSFDDFEAGFRKIEQDTRKETEENQTNDSKPTSSQQALEVSDKETTSQDAAKPLNVDESAKDDVQKALPLDSDHKHKTADLARDKTAIETRTKHRRVRQLVIGEDSEEFIEFATEPSTGTPTEVVQQIGDEGAIAVDAALEALTKDIGISPIADNKVEEILELQVQKSEISLEQLRKDLEGTSDAMEVAIGPEVEKQDYNDKLEHTKSKKSKDADQKKKKHTPKKGKSKSCSKLPAAKREEELKTDTEKELIGASAESNVTISEENGTILKVSKAHEVAKGPSSGSLDSVRSEPSADTNENTKLKVCEQTIESSIQAEVTLKPVLRRGRSRKRSQEDTSSNRDESAKNEENQPSSVVVSETTSRSRKSKLYKSTAEEPLALSTQELEKNISVQGPSPAASPIIERSLLSLNEHVAPKSAKKSKEKREEKRKPADIQVQALSPASSPKIEKSTLAINEHVLPKSTKKTKQKHEEMHTTEEIQVQDPFPADSSIFEKSILPINEHVSPKSAKKSKQKREETRKPEGIQVSDPSPVGSSVTGTSVLSINECVLSKSAKKTKKKREEMYKPDEVQDPSPAPSPVIEKCVLLVNEHGSPKSSKKTKQKREETHQSEAIQAQDPSPAAIPIIEKSILSINEHVLPRSAKKPKQKREEIHKSEEVQDSSHAPNPIIENSILAVSEHVLPKSAKKPKQKREEIHKSEEMKSADDTRRTRSHKKRDLSHTDDESVQTKEEPFMAMTNDDGNKSVLLDSKPQDDINSPAANSVSSISEEIAFSNTASKIRKSPRRKTNKVEKTVSPGSKDVENDVKSAIKPNEKDTDTDKLQKNIKTLESVDEVPAVIPEEQASLKNPSFAEKSARRLRSKARGNAEETCATLAVDVSKRKSESTIEPAKSADTDSDKVWKTLNETQFSDCTDALQDKIVSKTRSGKTMRMSDEAVAGKSCGTDTVELKNTVNDAITMKSGPDDVSCKLDAPNSEQKRPIEVELSETCSGTIENVATEIKNQEQTIDLPKELDLIADIPLPDKPPSKRGRSQKLEHEISVDVSDKRSSADVSDDQPQSKRITRSSRISNVESKVSVEKTVDVPVENVSKDIKPTETHELDQSVSICDISSKTEKHASRQTPSKRHTRRSELNQISVRGPEKMQLLDPAAASDSQKEKSSESDKITATECKKDKLSIIPKPTQSKERRRLKMHRSDKVSHTTDASSKVEEPIARIASNINEADVDVGLQENQESKTQLSARKQDVCSVTGIVSDVTYGRKAKEVRSGTSKVVKNRWDVVTALCNNNKSCELQAESVSIIEGETTVPSAIKQENHNTPLIEHPIDLDKPTAEDSKVETRLESNPADLPAHTEVSTCKVLGRKSQEADCKNVCLDKIQIDAVEKSDDQPHQKLLENADFNLINTEATVEASMEFSTTSTKNESSLEPPKKRCSRKSTSKSFTKSSELTDTAPCFLESQNQNVDVAQEVVSDISQSESSTNFEIDVCQAIVTEKDWNDPKITGEHNDKVEKKSHFSEACLASSSEVIRIRRTEEDANNQVALDKTHDQQSTDLEASLTPTIIDQKFDTICSAEKMEYGDQSLSNEIEVVAEKNKMSNNEAALLATANEVLEEANTATLQPPVAHKISDNLRDSVKPALVLGEEIESHVIPSISEEITFLGSQFSEKILQVEATKPDHRENNETKKHITSIPDTLEDIQIVKEDLETSRVNEPEKIELPVKEATGTSPPDIHPSSSKAFEDTSENLNALDHSSTLVEEVISNLITAVDDDLKAVCSDNLEKSDWSAAKDKSTTNVPQKSEADKHDVLVLEQAEEIQKFDSQLSETDIPGECSSNTQAQTARKSPEIYDTIQPEEAEPSIDAEENTEISDLGISSVTAESLKLVPPKKSKRPRRGSYANTETKKDHVNEQSATCEELAVEPQTSKVMEKTDHQTATEIAVSHIFESDIMLPPKKSKRANDVGTHLLKDYFSDDSSSEKKADNLQFPSFDESFMTSSFRNNIEGLLKEIDSLDDSNLDAAETPSKNTQKSDVKKGVDASIKYLSEVAALSDEKTPIPNVDFQKCVPPKKKKIDIPKDVNVIALTNQTVFDAKDKVSDSILETPKKKMQKLFENSQVIEKCEKTVELPQMSPLAKKKSFLFQQELDRQKVEVFVEKAESAETITEDPKINTTPEDSAVLLKTATKRKSVPSEHSPCKKEKLDVVEQLAKSDSSDQFVGKSTKDEKVVVPPLCSTSENETEIKVKKETSDNNSQSIVNKSCLLKSEKVSQLLEDKNELLNEIPRPFDVPREGMVSSLDSRVSGSNLIEPEMVPISVAPTIMSEQDLADAQVEITSEKIISEKQPSSLGSFSVGFPELGGKSVSVTQVKVTTDVKPKTTQSIGTEFPTKAMVKEFDNRPLLTQPNTYVLKSELLDILEGNSNSSTTSSGSEQKFKTSFDNYDKQSTVQGIIDFEDAIPSQIVLSNKVKPESVLLDSPKLLERLSMASKPPQKSDVNVAEKVPLLASKTIKRSLGIPKPGQKIIIKSQRAASKIPGSKPVILSEQIIRPASLASAATVKQASQGIKRQYEDVEDIETAFIIPKIAKKPVEEEVAQPMPVEKPAKIRSKASGKAKILQQTIISAKGEIASTQISKGPGQLQHIQIQPTSDESVFDINSMPIVLSDDILTAESIQNMPVVLSEDGAPKTATMPKLKPNEKLVATLPKKIATALGTKQIIFKTTSSASVTPASNKVAAKVTKAVAPSPTVPFSKFSKAGATAFIATGKTADGKPAKYVLVPPAVTPATTQVKSMKPTAIKKSAIPHKITQTGTAPASDPSQIVGNKIMIVTNAQGQQTRVVLTPQQQKVFMQGQAGSKTKTIIKGAIPKALLETAAAVAAAGSSGVAVKTTAAISQGATASVASTGGLLMSAIKSSKTVVPPKKAIQRPASKPQKTILIKNQLGQTVRRIQGTDDADLDRQVAEQLEAIKASARLQQANKTPEIINYANRPIPSTSNPICNRSSAIRKTPSKKIEPVKSKIPVATTQDAPKQESSISTISQQTQADKIVRTQAASKKMEQGHAPVLQKKESLKTETKQPAPSNEIENKRPESPLRQVVIQDGLGNLTTVTVGQILAIPSETVDGQPQSYMLVTVDESGNLTPLNNDALMSLDPSLGVGGDINNVVLQVDQTQGTIAAVKPTMESTLSTTASKENWATGEEKSKHSGLKGSQREPKLSTTEQPKPAVPSITVEQQVVIGDGILPGEPGGQQLIVTGDPTATRKFLESISDGTTDLANILASAENGNVLVQADGQQILIRTNPAAQAVLGTGESNTDTTSSSLFASHKPNQDILAAALANTDVFPSTDHSSILKGASSQVSPGSALFPMHVGNVLETSLTLSSPIMTPLEIPSTNSKKIDAEADILSQVPKNVDLPITITDPNISQTVANQQAASLEALELTLPIHDSVTGSINSPSYAYSLPSLEDSVGISQKSYSSSMPLLTEDVVEAEGSASSDSDKIRIHNSLKSSSSSFSPNFGTLPMLDSMASSQEDIVKASTFGDLDSMPMLADDIIDDSQSSIGSTKLRRSSRRSEERDIIDEGLSTLGGEMCSSLSEPPPDMFDLSSITPREEEISSDMSSIPEAETLSVNSENSGEIPLQPAIIANLNDLKRAGDDSEESDDKRPRFE